VLRGALFDWNNTLVRFSWDEERVIEGHRAALGRDDPVFTARWRTLVLGDHGYRPYAELLAELGVEDPDAFIDAEHEVWQPAHEVLSSAQALFESLRSLGLKTGIVANSWPEPGHVLRADAERFGLADRVDVMVFSDDVGARKPDPEIYLFACRQLGVEPSEAMHVGDDLENDVWGAAAVGITTVQALWFVADDQPVEGVEPDFRAFTPMDVLNTARQLARARR
jgi:HAD superfamily hydrolase (TIGR01509 family)